MTIILTAHVYAKKNYVSNVRKELIKLINPTRAESGCLKYDLHQDKENPIHFMFFEIWENYEVLEKHRNTSHLKDFKKNIIGIIERLEFNELEKVDS